MCPNALALKMTGNYVIETLFLTVYVDSFSELMEALSDDKAYTSMVGQLYSSSLISKVDMEAQMSLKLQPKARACSLLMVLGVEEKPQLLTELITAMKEVEELCPLAEEMAAQLSKAIQGI